MAGDHRLSGPATAALGNTDNVVFVSAVSAYEIALKHRLGKLPQATHLADAFESEVLSEDFQLLPLTASEALHAGRIDLSHRDPFDRLLIAQALLNNMTLVSNERLFDLFGVARVW